MQERNTDAKNPADKASEKAKPETVDLVVEHELHGVTPEMIDWWWTQLVDSQNYKLWHPEDHISIEWEVPPTKESRVGAIHVAEERFGEFPARKLRLRAEDPASSPIPISYKHVRAGSNLGPNDERLWWIVHQYEAAGYGTRMRSTFRLPADTPQQFIDALRQHNKGEMGQFPQFLPELYKKNAG